jgi:1-acyl-sn-glycerol-3-phosphate acyltransferase
MASQAAGPVTAGDILRSVAFYVAFYGVTVPLVTVGLILAPVSEGSFRWLVRGWGRWHRWCARHLLGIRLRIEGHPPTHPMLVAIKHESFFEAIDMPALFDLPAVFLKAELDRLPLWGLASRRYGNIAVERGEGARALRAMRRAALQRVAEGRLLVIFPEGTRVPHGAQPPLQAGFAGLYKLLGLPVVPVAVDSGPPYHRRWKRPGTITFRFGDPLPPGLPRDEIERRVHAAINALNGVEPRPSG